MMIRIMYNDGNFDIIKPGLLNALIEKEAITSFKRSDGWIVIGRDPIRRGGNRAYAGPERRRSGLSAVPA
jgi:hypothetical protein